MTLSVAGARPAELDRGGVSASHRACRQLETPFLEGAFLLGTFLLMYSTGMYLPILESVVMTLLSINGFATDNTHNHVIEGLVPLILLGATS